MSVSERSLDARELQEIRSSLRGKLLAHRLSCAFVDRWAEDALQKAVLEYLRAMDRGTEIRNRDAFLVDVAFKRAIDELRREARTADGSALEAMIETGEVQAPSTEEIAIERLRAEELRRAVEALPPEERQLLGLHYFERRPAPDAARLLHLSESSYRRRLKRTLRTLRGRLGVPDLPDRDSVPAIEIGLVAWASLEGARVPAGSGVLEQASSALAGLRDLTARALGSGDGERVAVLAGPAGKVAGGCAGAAVACLLTGVVGPGVGGVNLRADKPEPRELAKPMVRKERPARAVLPMRIETPVEAEGAPTPLPSPEAGSSAKHRAVKRTNRSDVAKAESEARRVEEQTSGIARAAAESENSEGAADSTVEGSAPESVTVSPPPPPPSGSQKSAEAAQAEAEFGAFK